MKKSISSFVLLTLGGTISWGFPSVDPAPRRTEVNRLVYHEIAEKVATFCKPETKAYQSLIRMYQKVTHEQMNAECDKNIAQLKQIVKIDQ